MRYSSGAADTDIAGDGTRSEPLWNFKKPVVKLHRFLKSKVYRMYCLKKLDFIKIYVEVLKQSQYNRVMVYSWGVSMRPVLSLRGNENGRIDKNIRITFR